MILKKQNFRILLIFILLLQTRCRIIEHLDSEVSGTIFNLSTNENPVNVAPFREGYISISDISGNNVDCFELMPNLRDKELLVSENPEEVYHISTIVRGRIRTYTNISAKNIFLQWRTDYCDTYLDQPFFNIYLESQGHDIEKVIYTTNDRYEEQIVPDNGENVDRFKIEAGHCPKNDRIFIAAKERYSNVYRYNFFERTDSLGITLDELQFEVQPVTYEFPDYEFPFVSIFGIDDENQNSLQRHKLSRSYNATNDTDFVLEGIFLENLFDRHATRIIFGKSNESFHWYEIGNPVVDYDPELIDFEVESAEKDNFVLRKGANYTYYEVVWKKDYVDINSNKEKTIYWHVYGDFEEGLVLPRLSTCEDTFIDSIELFEEGWSIHLVTEYRYSQFADYQEYLEYFLLQEQEINHLNEIGPGYNKYLERRIKRF